MPDSPKSKFPLFVCTVPGREGRFGPRSGRFGFWEINPQLLRLPFGQGDPNTGAGLDAQELEGLIDRITTVLRSLTKELTNVRRGRKQGPHVTRALELRASKTPWKQIYLDPEVKAEVEGDRERQRKLREAVYRHERRQRARDRKPRTK